MCRLRVPGSYTWRRGGFRVKACRWEGVADDRTTRGGRSADPEGEREKGEDRRVRWVEEGVEVRL